MAELGMLAIDWWGSYVGMTKCECVGIIVRAHSKV